jgi:hypothetical protein
MAIHWRNIVVTIFVFRGTMTLKVVSHLLFVDQFVVMPGSLAVSISSTG